MSAIERRALDGIAQVNVSDELPAIFTLAKALTKAQGFLPSHLKNEGEIAAVVLAGRELGIPPMASIRGIKLVKGNVTLDASLQLGCMMRAGCKVTWLDDGTGGTARLRLERPGQAAHEQVFSMEMAQRAGLAGGDNWRKYPAAMLRARCVSAAGKAYCPDILAGVYVPGEIDDEPAVVQSLPKRRTLDDVAAVEAPKADTPTDWSAHEYGDDAASHDPGTGEVYEAQVQPTPPDDGECPVFSSGRSKGQRYDEVPAGLLRALLEKPDFAAKAGERNAAWAQYVVDRYEYEKGGE